MQLPGREKFDHHRELVCWHVGRQIDFLGTAALSFLFFLFLLFLFGAFIIGLDLSALLHLGRLLRRFDLFLGLELFVAWFNGCSGRQHLIGVELGPVIVNSLRILFENLLVLGSELLPSLIDLNLRYRYFGLLRN